MKTLLSIPYYALNSLNGEQSKDSCTSSVVVKEHGRSPDISGGSKAFKPQCFQHREIDMASCPYGISHGHGQQCSTDLILIPQTVREPHAISESRRVWSVWFDVD
ncbi:hypothetical protein M8J77_007188 [Diaphorina citri]|nr:hypothetical protein M8J77_007188 [Diaphorina citri]